MDRSYILFVLLYSSIYFSYAAKLIDPKKCQGGCQADTDCVLNSECRQVAGDECGMCVCPAGFQTKGLRCVAIKGYTTTTASTITTTPTTPSTEPTTVAAPAPAPAPEPAPAPAPAPALAQPTEAVTTQPTTTGTTPQPAQPPHPEPLSCSGYDCSAGPNLHSNDDNPMEVRLGQVDTSASNNGCKRQLVIPPRSCNMIGGGQCFGSYCLSVSSGNDYCICPPYRVDRQCAVDKPGSCSSATGQTPSGGTTLSGTRLRNPREQDHGSIYARHFCSSMSDCVKLCQWTNGACRSVNFGQINGANVCELMSICATKKNLLASWLQPASGWQYAQVIQTCN